MAVASSSSSLPEFIAANTPPRTGEDFRGVMQQTAEASQPEPYARRTESGEKAGESGKSSTRKPEAHKKPQPDRPNSAAQDLATGVSPIPQMAPTILPGAGLGENSAESAVEGVSDALDTAIGRLDTARHIGPASLPVEGSGQPGMATDVAGNLVADAQSIAAAEAANMARGPLRSGATGESLDQQNTEGQSAIAKDAWLTAHAPTNAATASVATVADFKSLDIAPLTSLGEGWEPDANSEAAGASDTAAAKASRQRGLDGIGAGEGGDAERLKQAVAGAHVPVPTDATDLAHRTPAGNETAAPKATASSQKKTDSDPAGRATANCNKAHDRLDWLEDSSVAATPGASGAHQVRAVETAGFSSALHPSLSTDLASARGGNRFEGSSDAKADLISQDAAVAPSRDAAGSQLTDGVAMPMTVNTARLVQRMKESEINLNVRSVDFGNVAIRTAMSHERLSAQISLEHNELGKAIAGDVAGLQSKLSDQHGIQATIEVQAQGQSFAGGGGQTQQQQTWRPQATSSAVVQQESREAALVVPAITADGRVDIRV
jgi:hypothetical protein